MWKPVLRNKVVGWIDKSVKHLQTPREGRLNIVAAAFERLYLSVARNPEVLAAARAEEREAAEKARKAEYDAKVQAAVDAAIKAKVNRNLN